MPAGWPSVLRERRSEARHPALAAKPSIFGRAVQRAAVCAAVALIAYGTLGPVADSALPWIRANANWRWLPPLRPANLNDLVTNVAVYLPVGAAVCLLGRRRGSGWVGPLAAVLVAAFLSWSTEFLQQFLPARVASGTDILINVTAAVGGVLIAPPLQRWLRRLHGAAFVLSQERCDLLLAGIALSAVGVSMTAPWSLHWPRVDLAIGSGVSASELSQFALFAALGALWVGAATRGESRAGRGALISAACMIVLAGGFEMVQSIFAGHECSLRDWVWESLGGLFGVALRSLRGSRSRRLALPAFVAITLFVVGMLITDASSMRLYSPRIDWTPLYAEFNRAFTAAASDMLASIVLSFCISVAVVRSLGSRAKAPLLLLLLSACVVAEFFRALFQGHTASSTAPLLAATGWLLAVRLGDSLRPLRASDARGASGAPPSAISSAPLPAPI